MNDLHFGLTEVTAPTVEPFTTTEAKSHLRVTVTDDDTLIDNLILAARNKLETDIHRALITQTWNLFLDRFPISSNIAILIPKTPLQSIVSIKYVDTDGDTQTWASANYIVDSESEPGRVTPAFNKSYPITRAIIKAVTIQFKGGYGDAGSNIPQDLRQAMLMLIGHFYENREAVQAGVAVTNVPMAYKYLKTSHVVYDF